VARTQAETGTEFKALHEGEPFILANAWDAGSAKVLAGLGFKALASTSAGFAYTLGRPDGAVTLDEVVQHVAALAAATALPLSVDLENGYGPEPEDAARAIARVAEAGAVGGSIEDYDPEGHIYELEYATERIAAAVEAARALDFPFTLTARAENHFRGNPDLDDTIARLQAYERAGADVVYAPGLRELEQIKAIADATSKPVNVLATPSVSMTEIVEAGGQRISLGSWLGFVGVGAIVEAAERMRDAGDFSVLTTARSPMQWLGS
jgi:2-methylisocitrate lyase-like PEP mutase family enzyme